jgi:Rieske Fe-S protein
LTSEAGWTPPKPEPLLSRRDFIRNSVRLAVAGAVLPGLASQVLPAIAPAALSGGGPGPVIKRDAKQNPFPVTLADLKEQPGNQPFVGEWGFLPAIVYMVKADVLRGSSAYQGYNTAQHAVQHPTQSKYALMVYRGKCKHLGCTVGWNGALGAAKPEVGKEDYDGDGINDGRILCPCHQGQYDIHNLARNQPATPPPAPLDVIRFNVVKSFSDPDGLIPNASDAIVGVEVIQQDKYLMANKSPMGSQFRLRDAAKIQIKPKDYTWEAQA